MAILYSVLYLPMQELSSLVSVLMTLFEVHSLTYFAVVLTLGILAAPWLSAFENRATGQPWGTDKSIFGKLMIYTVAFIYLASNVMMFVMSWLPAEMQETLFSKGHIIPTYLGPLLGILYYVVGILLWVWDFYILPALGWKMEPLQEERLGLTVHMTFQVWHSTPLIKAKFLPFTENHYWI
jgi:hypothetical protein